MLAKVLQLPVVPLAEEIVTPKFDKGDQVRYVTFKEGVFDKIGVGVVDKVVDDGTYDVRPEEGKLLVGLEPRQLTPNPKKKD